jgi:hypothetical protein
VEVKELHQEYGQSVRLDAIRRHLLESGDFARLVQEDGIRGVTSNPSIFEKAIVDSTDYGPALQARGGFLTLARRDRRALRVHLGADVRRGLEVLSRSIEWVLT